MIRNVVMGRLADSATEADRAQLQHGLDGIAALTPPGLLSMKLGMDAGLRDGGWTFAITNDWEDEAAYRAYDAEAEHNVFRKLIVGVCAEVARVQFEI